MIRNNVPTKMKEFEDKLRELTKEAGELTDHDPKVNATLHHVYGKLRDVQLTLDTAKHLVLYPEVE